MNVGTGTLAQASIILFQRSTVNSRQTNHLSNKTKITWTHPNKGTIIETLCEQHADQVVDALELLGIGCTGYTDDGVCLRCIYDGYDITTWMDQWA